MKALLLAAGLSTRMKPIKDKNALKFFGKPLVQYQLESLIRAGYKDIALLGGAHNLDFLKNVITGIGKRAKITLIEQKKIDGMATAVIDAEKWIDGKPLLVMSGNDIVLNKAFVKFKKPGSKGLLLAKKVNSYFPGGYLTVDKKGRITKIVEKPDAGKEPGDLVNLVVHYHPDTKALVKALRAARSKHDDKYEVALQSLFESVEYHAVSYDGYWQPVKYPWHVLDVTGGHLGLLKSKKGRDVKVAKSAVIDGNVYLNDGVRVLANAVIKGPAYIGKNTIVATGALVRDSHIGDNCVIGFGSEIARSYIGDDVWTHTNYIGDSVIGNNVSFGAGTVTGNLRLDEGNIRVDINGKLIDTGRDKFGIITGDDIRVGINTSLMPGKKIGSNSMVGAGITVAQDIPDNSFVYGKSELIVKKNKFSISHRS